MALVLRRKFKIKEQLLLMILPFIAIPIILILAVRVYLFDFIKNSKDEVNTSIIKLHTQNINNDFKGSVNLGYGYFELKNSSLNKDGILFILDLNNKILYTNYDKKAIDEKIEIDSLSIINSTEMKNIFRGGLDESKYYIIENDCHIFDFKIENKKYQGYLYNSILYDRLKNVVKVLYLYPRKKITGPINPIILFILIISIIVYLIVGYLFYRQSEIYTYPLNNLKYMTKKASQGYLNFDIVSESKDELGQLYKNFTEMIKFNKSILIDISNSSNNLMGYQKSLERSIADFNDKLKNQNSTISENAKIVDDFNEMINKQIQHIRNVKGIIENTQTQSDESTELINEMISDINNIAQTGQQINYIAEMLNKISEKTRLLSVNSAIEASRAGDVGKGFGVVATEIRKLAVLAKDSAKEIGELVKVNDSKIISGINKTNEVLGSLKNINSSIKMINQIIEQINLISQDEKINSQTIIINEKNFISETSDNTNSLESIEKIRNLFKMDLEKIKNAIKKIIFDIREKVTIRDVKLYTEEDKDIIKKVKVKKDSRKDRFKREPALLKNLRKDKARKSSKLDTVRSITLYKPKKSILDKFIK